MDELTLRDYAKYPFLSGARERMKTMPAFKVPFGDIIKSKSGAAALDLARRRVTMAMGKETPRPTPVPMSIEQELLSYVLARAIVSSAKSNESLVEKLVEYEADKVVETLKKERSGKREKILTELKFDIKRNTVSLFEFIPLSVKISQTEPEYKLVNTRVSHGLIHLKYDQMQRLLKEKIKVLMKENLPMTVPSDAAVQLSSIAEEIFKGFYSTINTDLGGATEEDFPPCIIAIMDSLSRGDNLTHPARFALVAFMNAVGKKEEEIINMFRTVRDFNESMTQYQVRHITGVGGGTKYSAPACATLKTNGLCTTKAPLCSKVAHPLGYYSARKRWRLKGRMDNI